MPRRCSVCEHKDVAEINSALALGEPLRFIAYRWSVSKTDLMRHRNQHLPVSVIMAKETQEIDQASDLLDQIRDLQERTQAILERAEEAQELSIAVGGIREARRNLQLLAKLLRNPTNTYRRKRRL